MMMCLSQPGYLPVVGGGAGIARVAGQKGGNHAESATLVTRAFTNPVQVGSLITIVGMKFSPGLDAFVAGDCSKSAGGASIDTPTLDRSHNFNHAASDYLVVGVWSCLVTVAGTLTMQVSGALAGSFLVIGTDEYTGNWTGARLETGNDGQGTSTTPSTGNATSAGAALFVAGTATNCSSTVTHAEDLAWNLTFEDEAGTTDATGSAITRIVTSGTTDDGSWTLGSSTQWDAALAVYKEG